MAKIVLSGYYGFNNTGDEAILYTMLRTLLEIDPELEITVLSADPTQTEKQYGAAGVKVVNRWSIFEVVGALARCDLLLSGGGSLLQDVSSANGILYYLGIIFLARFLEKPVMVYAQGIGPITRRRNKKITGWVLNGVNKITVRDEESKDDLQALGVQQEITVTADPVFGLYKTGIEDKAGQEILERYGIKKEESGKLLGVYLRPWGKNEYVQALGEALKNMAEQGWKIVFVPMQFPVDITVAKEAKQLLNNDQAVILKEKFSSSEVLSLTKNFDLILGMRLHSLIMAAVTGVPLVGLSYDPKIDRFLRQIGQVALLSTNNLKAPTLVELLTWADEKREEIVPDMEIRAQGKYQKAWQTARIAMSLLEEKEKAAGEGIKRGAREK